MGTIELKFHTWTEKKLNYGDVLLTSQNRFYLSFGGSLTLQISNSRFSRRCFKFVLVYLHNFTLTICYSCYKHGVCFIVWNSIPNSYNFWLIDLRGTNCLFRLYDFVKETPEDSDTVRVYVLTHEFSEVPHFLCKEVNNCWRHAHQ